MLIHVPSTVHHDCPGQRVAVGRVESLEPHRVTVGADVERTRPIGSGGSCVRMRLVRESLKPPRMGRIGTPSMGNQVGPHAAIRQVHQMKSGCARRQREVGDADKVAVPDAVLMLLQSSERSTKQTAIDFTADAFNSTEGERCSRGPRSKTGKRKIDKKTTGNCQDIELQEN